MGRLQMIRTMVSSGAYSSPPSGEGPALALAHAQLGGIPQGAWQGTEQGRGQEQVPGSISGPSQYQDHCHSTSSTTAPPGSSLAAAYLALSAQGQTQAQGLGEGQDHGQGQVPGSGLGSAPP